MRPLLLDEPSNQPNTGHSSNSKALNYMVASPSNRPNLSNTAPLFLVESRAVLLDELLRPGLCYRRWVRLALRLDELASIGDPTWT